jgi:hypothetical protein
LRSGWDSAWCSAPSPDSNGLCLLLPQVLLIFVWISWLLNLLAWDFFGLTSQSASHHRLNYRTLISKSQSYSCRVSKDCAAA